MEGTCGYCFWRSWRETVGVHTILQFTHIWTSQRIHLTYNSFKMKKKWRVELLVVETVRAQKSCVEAGRESVSCRARLESEQR